jgi:hypothetical protein
MIATVGWKTVKRDNGQSTLFHSPEVTLWDGDSGKELRRLAVRPSKKSDGHEIGPTFVAFTPDSRQLVTGAQPHPPARALPRAKAASHSE